MESYEIGVLIVDDSALMRNIIAKIVDNTPGLVVAGRAMNGQFALDKIPVCKPDVIVLDIEMPVMDGLEFLKERKKRGIDIPVIMLSSLTTENAAVTMQCIELGASDFLPKPNASSQDGNLGAVAARLAELLPSYGGRYAKQKGNKCIPLYRPPIEGTPVAPTPIFSFQEENSKTPFTVIYFDIDNFEDYLSVLEICANITNRPDLYQKNGVALREQIEQIKQEFCKQEFTNSEKTVLLLRTSSTGVKVKGSEGTILGEMLSDIGALNIADTNESLLENLSLEAILLLDPHHIFVVTMGSDTDQALDAFHRMTEDNGAWASLSAVREGRVHLMDKTLFNQKPNARYPEAYETLLEKLLTK